MAPASQDELVFVVDVSSLTKKGFVGTSKYEGRQIEVEFDDGTSGVVLTSEMAGRLRVRKGSKVSILIEDDRNQIVEAVLAGVGRAVRVSDAKVYYSVGRDGGGILRLRKAQPSR